MRMLRAVRFAARLGFEIEPETFGAIVQYREKAAALSAERIREELTKMLCGPNPAEAFRLLDKTGLLEIVLPEIAAFKGVTQPEKFHPEGDVFEHTMLMLDHMAAPEPDLAWAVLLHDVGKPRSMTVAEDGTEHFYCHDKIGEGIAKNILLRLKFSGKSVEKICAAVLNHMKFAFASEMKASKWRRMMASENFPLELELHRIDCVSCHGKLQNYVFFLDKIIASASEVALPPPLLTGADLKGLGLKPGPLFGEILNEISDMQLEAPSVRRKTLLRL